MTEEPGYSPDHLLRGLSLSRRVGQLVAGLGGLAGALLIAQLWATEPDPLPTRTQLAFAALVAVGLSWAGYGAWALVRRPLFALDRVIAGCLATVVSALTTVGMVVVAVSRGGVGNVLVTAGVGLVFTVAAGTLLLRARAYRAALLATSRGLGQQHH